MDTEPDNPQPKPEQQKTRDAELVRADTVRLPPDPASAGARPGRIKVLAPDGDIPREIPVRLGRYVIDGLIGRGGMGVVYKARQDGLSRVVALKLLLQGEHATPEGRRRFEREARAIARLRHPNIVSVHEVGEYNGLPFFTMDYIDGVSLTAFVKRVPIESQEVIADLCARIADAVDYAHEQGVIHRDLKPDNILMTANGEPIITDFGLAKDLDSVSMLSLSGEVLGTPAFMAPEQATGRSAEADRRTDVYALGAVLYWLLTRHEPFEGQSMVEKLSRVATEDPPPATRANPSVHSDLCAICLKAMDRDKLMRYQTAKEFADDLRRFLEGYPVHAQPWSWHRAVRRFGVRHKWALAAAAAAVVAVLAAGALSATIFSRTYFEIAGKRLAAPDPIMRAQALKDLGREILNPHELRKEDVPKALARLAAMGSDADDRVITAWLEFLSDSGDAKGVADAIGPEPAGRLLQRADSTDKPRQRNLAIAAIGKIRRPDFAEHLIRRLSEPNPSLRMLIVRSLGDQRSPKALGPLINVVTADPICRAEAKAALERLYREGRLAFFDGQDLTAKTSLRKLTDAMATYNSQMEEALDEVDGKKTPTGPFAAYQDALASGNPESRIKAVYELGMTADKGAAPLLMAALDDPDPGVGSAAAMALSQVDPAGQIETLRNGLSAPSPTRRGNAALALGFIKSKESLDPLLVALAGEKDLAAKKRMIGGLSEMGLSTAIPGLEEAARSDPRVRPDVDSALRRIR
jgi:HEAT repeat protein/predicted Ser/Thr protein kinase